MFEDIKEKVKLSLKGLEELKYKYVKRTGSPGSYVYWYRNASGKLTAGKTPGEGSVERSKLGEKMNLTKKTDKELQDMKKKYKDALGSLDKDSKLKKDTKVMLDKIEEEITSRGKEGKKPSSSGKDKDIDKFIKDGWDNRYGNEIGETDNDIIVEDEGDLFMEYLENEHPKLPDKEREKLTEKFQDKLTKKLNEATKKNKTEKKNLNLKAIVTAMEEKRRKMKMSVDKFYAIPRIPPSESKLPMFDAAHVRNALARLKQVKGVSEKEKKTALNRLVKAAKKFKIETTMKKKVEKKSFEKDLFSISKKVISTLNSIKELKNLFIENLDNLDDKTEKELLNYISKKIYNSEYSNKEIMKDEVDVVKIKAEGMKKGLLTPELFWKPKTKIKLDGVEGVIESRRSNPSLYDSYSGDDSVYTIILEDGEIKELTDWEVTKNVVL